jgi:hypothetical protein
MEFKVTGSTIEDAQLAHLRVRAPDGTLSPLTGLYCPMGATLIQALELFVHDHPGYSIVMASPSAIPGGLDVPPGVL